MSKSHLKFVKNMSEIEDLLAMHVDITPGNAGRPAEKVAALNKAGRVCL